MKKKLTTQGLPSSDNFLQYQGCLIATGVFRTQKQHSGNQEQLLMTFIFEQAKQELEQMRKLGKQFNLQANSPHTVSGSPLALYV